MRRLLLISACVYAGLFVASILIVGLLPTHSAAVQTLHGCFRTDAMLAYVACRGVFLPAAVVLNIPFVAVYMVLGASVIGDDPLRGSMALALACVLWAPLVYLAWRGLTMLPPRLALSICLLGLVLALGRLLLPAPTPVPRPAGGPESPPQLWSGHKQVAMPAAACGDLAASVLGDLGFTDVVQSGSYAYGNRAGNRAAVKCIGNEAGSFIYYAVAGAETAAVEDLRDQLAGRF